VKVYYNGAKAKIGILLPIGITNRSGATGVLEFVKGEPQELDEADAQKLLGLDSSFSGSADPGSKGVEPKAEAPEVAPKGDPKPKSDPAKPKKKKIHPPKPESMEEVEAKLKGKS
jgi:hypothetical protein